MPNDLVRAIAHAHRLLDWEENLQSEEMPPEWMWPFDDELEAWFEEVQRKRDEKYGGDSSASSEPMMSNDLAEGRRG